MPKPTPRISSTISFLRWSVHRPHPRHRLVALRERRDTLDVALGITADGFSFLVMGLAARLSTMVSYDQVTGLLMNFLSWSPSKMSIEKAVLGLGRYTAEWFELAPPPEGDGEVLVIQFDSKATPTATDSELEKRRRKRGPRPVVSSPRHRGRDKRRRRGSKPRRKKGDKSKNGRAVTLAVMYTLREATDEKGRRILEGPINRRFYGSYAAKRHAFIIARREANKRGFGPESGKRIQIVTDGDDDLRRYGGEFFPEAIHTLDVMHVMEHLWEAGACLYKEGSLELTAWVKKMENLIYQGKAIKVVGLLAEALAGIPKTGPGNKGKRERLESNRDYLFNRIDQMNYDWLRRQDLEFASGNVEGAVNHVIAKRFDSGGMRWIRERAEALLQLRCIDLNGDWDSFMTFVGEAGVHAHVQGFREVLALPVGRSDEAQRSGGRRRVPFAQDGVDESVPEPPAVVVAFGREPGHEGVVHRLLVVPAVGRARLVAVGLDPQAVDIEGPPHDGVVLPDGAQVPLHPNGERRAQPLEVALVVREDIEEPGLRWLTGEPLVENAFARSVPHRHPEDGVVREEVHVITYTVVQGEAVDPLPQEFG
jgi:hypothetical protein